MKQTMHSAALRQASVKPWLASLLIKQRPRFNERFLQCYWWFQKLPRRMRRQMKQRLALSTAGVALALTLVRSPVSAANITVVNGEIGIIENDKCSLSEAIWNANYGGQAYDDCNAGGSGADTITLPANGDFLLNNALYTGYGLPIVDSTITIQGNGSTIRRSNTAPHFRLLSVWGGNLTLNNVTLRRGFSDSGGGAIHVQSGIVTLNNSTLDLNRAANGGAIALSNTTGFFPELNLNNSTLTGNIADNDGGAIVGNRSTVKIHDSSLSNNDANGLGGAIKLDDGYLGLYGSTVATNEAFYSGGGIAAFDTSITLYDSTIQGNTVASTYMGGGIYMRGFNETPSAAIRSSTISGNEARYGGGISFQKSYVFMLNSTISGNSASFAGGGILVWPDVTLQIEGSTLTGNSATVKGGGMYVNAGNVAIRRTLISGNTAGSYGFGQEVMKHAVNGTVTVNSTNIFGDGNYSGLKNVTPGATDIVPSGAIGTILNTTLANNGGPTQTHALAANSPAIDAAPNNLCTGVNDDVDQRGEPRNVNGKGGVSTKECDIGAFEVQGGPPPAAVDLYVTVAAAGNVGGVDVTPQDILFFDAPAGTWSMFFDGSDVGVTKPISAFTRRSDGSILLSLAANQSLTGPGAVTPWDVVRFVPSSTGNNTQGTFQLWVDGADVGLTTTAEKIDALEVLPDGKLVLSTGGTASVPKSGGGKLKAQDEDLLRFTPTATGSNSAGTWALYWNGTAVAGMDAEDVNGAAVNPANNDIYVTLLNGFNLGGLTGGPKDVLIFAAGGTTPQHFWRGADHGLTVNLSGIDVNN